MNKGNENQAGRRDRRQFDETYNRHAVELTLQAGRSVRAVVEELGITDSPVRVALGIRASAQHARPAPQRPWMTPTAGTRGCARR